FLGFSYLIDYLYFVFYLLIRPLPNSTLFPYTTLFRSASHHGMDASMLFDASPWPTWILDAETHGFLAVNCAATAQYGYSEAEFLDRKSTRLNSSHLVISYAVFCLKKKKKYII